MAYDSGDRGYEREHGAPQRDSVRVLALLAQNKALKDMLRDGISKFGDNPHPASTTEVNARHWAAMAAALLKEE